MKSIYEIINDNKYNNISISNIYIEGNIDIIYNALANKGINEAILDIDENKIKNVLVNFFSSNKELCAILNKIVSYTVVLKPVINLIYTILYNYLINNGFSYEAKNLSVDIKNKGGSLECIIKICNSKLAFMLHK